MKGPPFLALMILGACGSPEPTLLVHHGEAMGSTVEIQVIGDDPALLRRGIAEALGEIERIERMMTTWKDDSPLMEVNRGAGVGPVRVPEEIFFIVKRSLEISAMTDGAFDITWAGAGKLWDWASPDPRIPSAEEIRTAVANVGWRLVVLDEKARTVHLTRSGMRIGLGAIVPGYAGDLAMRKIRALGIRNALVNMSGEVLAVGRKNGAPWRVGVTHPRKPGASIAMIPLSNMAVATSGDYERFFIRDGRRYGHIIDPRTGYPADLCRSTTVTAPTLVFADALSTAVFVLGPERGMKLIEKLEGVEGMIVAADGSVTVSSGLERTDPGKSPD